MDIFIVAAVTTSVILISYLIYLWADETTCKEVYGDYMSDWLAIQIIEANITKMYVLEDFISVADKFLYIAKTGNGKRWYIHGYGMIRKKSKLNKYLDMLYIDLQVNK